MEILKKAYYIARKDLKAYYLKPPLISWGLMLPLVFILSFYLRNPGGIAEVGPGLVGMTMLFSTTSMAAIVISFEKRIDALERLLLAPLDLRTILFGKALGAAGFGFGMALISLVFIIFLFGLTVSHPVLQCQRQTVLGQAICQLSCDARCLPGFDQYQRETSPAAICRILSRFNGIGVFRTLCIY